MIGIKDIEQTSKDDNSVNRLLESIKSFLFGKREAFAYIYNSTSAELLSVCKRYASNNDEAKDILQESYIKIYKNLDKYDLNSPFKAWAKRIVMNTAIDHYRKSLGKSFKSMDNIEDVEEDVFVDNELLNCDIDMVMQAIQELPHGYRIIINLYVLESKSHKEISEMLNISEGTSRSQLFKARKSLKAKFENE